MKAIGAYIHSKGLKAGIYTHAGKQGGGSSSPLNEAPAGAATHPKTFSDSGPSTETATSTPTGARASLDGLLWWLPSCAASGRVPRAVPG